MRIVIDLQSVQTGSRLRGIGRYSLSLAKAMVRNRTDHEIIVVLSGLFPDSIEPIRDEFDDCLPQENIRIWYAPGPVLEKEQGNTWRREVAENIRESFLASLKPDVVHIMSLFEGYVDDAVTSICRFDQTTPTSVILYDLIPFLNPKKYLSPNLAYEQFYLRKINYLRKASMVFAISHSSRQEGLTFLGLPSESIINISGAADECFRPLSLSEEQSKTLRDKFCLNRSFVLYSGGDDERKNLLRLVRAYAQLSPELRKTHQLVFAGEIYKTKAIQIQKEAEFVGLHSNELIFTGYVTNEELVMLYNLCKLYVFPSWHEGFGLPVLEAMSCGTPTIGSNIPSLIEIFGHTDALFDPFSEDDIANKITYSLTNEDFRHSLSQRGLRQAQKFSWNATAVSVLDSLEKFYAEHKSRTALAPLLTRKPKLAYVSPLPPERSGISDYSAELLPELSRHYDIEVIIAQDLVSDPWIQANYKIRSVEWFRAHANHFERILYHFGNSHFHQHMFSLLESIPGIVVLHDFFLSGIVAHMDMHGINPNGWVRELYQSHGYMAAQERLQTSAPEEVAWKYPCNLSVLKGAQGVIVHSQNSRSLAKEWCPAIDVDRWEVVPLLRVPVFEVDREKARRTLSFNSDAFVICSFGMLGPSKCNHRLLEAWLASNLAKHENCILVFVGENHGGIYGQELLDTINHSGLTTQVRITGWVDTETFRHYLAVADIGVQLRTLSRGETSATVLDCMKYGISTICNANGSMAELPDDAVWKLKDEFDDNQLIDALETLWRDNCRREQLGKRAQEVINNHYSPRECADQYSDAIERFSIQARKGIPSLVQAVSILNQKTQSAEYLEIAQSIAQNFPEQQAAKQILLDISATCRTDLKTGIERVARSLLLELLKVPPEGYRVEPVYLSEIEGSWHYRYARTYTFNLLGCSTSIFADELVETQPGDIVIGLDLFGQGLVNAQSYLDRLHRDGIKIHFLVFDLLPVLSPDVFPPGSDDAHTNWLKTIARYDGAICISKSVSEELTAWIEKYREERLRAFKISWFHLGADIENSLPSRGIPNDAEKVLKVISERPSFLMVGTIEPRKGHIQTISAFEELWAEGVEANLVVVGKEGWKGLPDDMRRTIPDIVNLLRGHPELNKKLFWLDGVSDEYLEEIYSASECLLATSEGEGFGLPLIEAAQHKLPIIARDIPVFREVAGEYAYYFTGKKPRDLKNAVGKWLSLFRSGHHQKSTYMPWITWEQSSRQLIEAIRQPSMTVRKKALAEHLDLIHQSRTQMVRTLLPPGEIILDLGGANCPIYKMGYPHKFKKLVLIDLPADERCDLYKEVVVDSDCDGGMVEIKYGDMTKLDYITDGSIDFVWSGQSIEHVPLEAGRRMCQAAFRVLKKGGSFCLDTPNRRLTEIHTRMNGGGYIHPEHCIEYYPQELEKILLAAGFQIKQSLGLCEMSKTLDENDFCYEDFMFGKQIIDDITRGYIQFFHCIKP